MKTPDGKYECDNCFVDVGHMEGAFNGSEKEVRRYVPIGNSVPEKLREKTGFEHLCKTCFDALRVEMMRHKLNQSKGPRPMMPDDGYLVPVDME